MKFGYRTPSLKKSVKARTTGRAKRAVKRATNPYYGVKGAGVVNNPKKAAYNKVYHKTTASVLDSPTKKQAQKKKTPNNNKPKQSANTNKQHTNVKKQEHVESQSTDYENFDPSSAFTQFNYREPLSSKIYRFFASIGTLFMFMGSIMGILVTLGFLALIIYVVSVLIGG